MSFDPYADGCIHPASIVSHLFSSACKWQLLQTPRQPTHSPPSLSNLHPLPLFPIFLFLLAFLYRPFHNNEISNRWRWIKSVLFTPLDYDGKGSVILMGFLFSRCPIWRHFFASTACPAVEIGPIRGCGGHCIKVNRKTFLTRSTPHHMVTVSSSQEGWYQRCNLCFFFLAPSLPLV